MLYVARCYVIDAGLCSNSGQRAVDSEQGATDEQLPMIEQPAHEPSKPGRPVAECDRGIYVTVTWTRPEDDGGTDITAYVIKYKCSHYNYLLTVIDTNVDDYATVKVDGDRTNFTFTDQLDELTWHQFAVAAVNTAGQGEFSEFSQNVRTHSGK